MADGGMGDAINLHQNDILLFHLEDSLSTRCIG